MNSMQASFLITGYTGEVGKAVVKEIVNNKCYSRIIGVGRRKVAEGDPAYCKEIEQRIIDFDNIKDYKDCFADATIHICCLGTTRKKAGLDGLRKVDLEYVKEVARMAKLNNCVHFHLVSSVGADLNSFSPYLKIKAEAEEAVKGFDFERLSIYRPGLLMVDRMEFRLIESICRKLLRPVNYLLPGKFTTDVKKFASFIIHNCFTPATTRVEIFQPQNLIIK